MIECPNCLNEIELMFYNNEENGDIVTYIYKAYCPECNKHYVITENYIWDGIRNIKEDE